MFTAGALWVVAGTRSFAQLPDANPQENLPMLPAPAVQPETQRVPVAVGQPVTPGATVVHAETSGCAVNYGRDGRDYRASQRSPCLAYRDYGAAPLGAMMHDAFQTQVTNGVAAQMTLHDFDFVCGGDKLNLRGSDHLLHIAQFWRAHNYVLTIERTPHAPVLAEKRRTAVMNYLAERGIIVPPELVVVGPSPSLPLRGFEAELLFTNLMQQIQNRGIILPQGGSSGTVLGQGTGGLGTLGSGLGSGALGSGMPLR
jgi:hypothetical protein